MKPVRKDQHAYAITMLREKYPQYGEMAIDRQPAIVITPQSSHAWKGSDAAPRFEDQQDRLDLDFATIVRERHVVRQFKPIPIPREVVEQTIEAAGWAPSPHGAQPWRFVVLTQQEPKKRLAEVMA